MPALTRSRAANGDVPTAMNALYYAQRAGAGLIVTEGSQVSPQGKGYILTPGIHSSEQVAGWKLVTEAVHAKGGRIFLQLWHVGRMSHRDLQIDGKTPVAPSAIKPVGQQCYTQEGFKDVETPHALSIEEIAAVIADFRRGAENAKAAGFDGVELHGANGYLIDQFLQDKTNQRTDRYGGSIEKRTRFLLELADAASDVWGENRVGVRIAPENRLFDIADSNPQPLFEHVAAELSKRGIAYLSVIEGDMTGTNTVPFDYAALRHVFKGCYLANKGYDQATATAALAAGRADLVAFGRPFIANPDLVERFRKGAPLNEPDANTFYGGDEKGYVDYPTMDALQPV
jgi:N-ethylmaleimide reductase